jgi:hypothetical protein
MPCPFMFDKAQSSRPIEGAVCLICIRNDDAVTEGGDGTLSRLPLRMVTVRDGSAHRCTDRISTPQPGAGAAEVSVAPGLRSPPA